MISLIPSLTQFYTRAPPYFTPNPYFRFINLCHGDAIFATEDPRVEDLLPIEDSKWFQNVRNHVLLRAPESMSLQLITNTGHTGFGSLILRYIL
jgi:hypothetical protein